MDPKLTWCGIWFDPVTGMATVRANVSVPTPFGGGGFDVTVDRTEGADLEATARKWAAQVAAFIATKGKPPTPVTVPTPTVAAPAA